MKNILRAIQALIADLLWDGSSERAEIAEIKLQLAEVTAKVNRTEAKVTRSEVSDEAALRKYLNH